PAGITALAAVPAERAAELDALLPAEAEIPAAVHAYNRAQFFNDQAAARAIVNDTSAKFPQHSGTKYLRALHSLETGKTSEALNAFRELLAQFPTSALVRTRFMYVCRALSNLALLRDTLEQIVETGTMPGVQAQQEWMRPHDRYVGEYADLLRLSADTRNRAKRLLLSVLRRQWNSASAWHTLADLLWSEQDRDNALLAYRFGSLLSDSTEHFARSYADALAQCGRLDECFQWLENRVQRYRTAASAVSTWITWIDMLEDWGSPEKALDACKQALEQHPGSPGLLVSIVPFLARMGDWEAAEKQLRIMEQSDSRAMFHEASVAFYRMRGEIALALHHAELWHKEVPRSIAAATAFLDLLRVIHGPNAAMERAAAWMREQPANEDLEELFCQQADSVNASGWRKLRVLMRRTERNPDDGWAWRELFFSTASLYEMRQDKERSRIAEKIERFLTECDRTSAEDATNFRAHALWNEDSGRWDEAVSGYLEAIRREPRHFYAYRRVWEASSRLAAPQRRAIWAEIEPLLLRSAGHLPNAREMTVLLSERFGVREAEQTVTNWMQQRPNDPNVVEAAADLLIDHGQGRSDAGRALALLKPAVERFPFHAGLRFSLANAHRALGEHAEAAQVFRELVRRHPDNTDALMQLAWVQHYDGDPAAALATLEEAKSRAPQNTNPIVARVQILLENQSFEEAAQVLKQGLESHPESVPLRERAINVFTQCGLPESAVEAAREGVRVHPRGSYLWLLLGRTLRENPQFASQGEVEACLRKSLSLNGGLFETADLLAMFLVEQKRYEPALKLMSDVEGRLSDPSSARGRRAWIIREQGHKKEAVEDIARTVESFPWYAWGWNLLISFLEEDQDWNRCRELLDTVPPQMLANLDFRLQRLSLLEKAGTATKALDEEWAALLHDFPEDVRLHLRRYDNLVSKERFQEASEVIEKILPATPDNSFVLARVTEVRCREHK
ncbi:MAG TPA: tetratricopeptide repeat protein, partial [Terriglobales bacterium]